MVAEHTEPAVSFQGTKGQKDTAKRAFRVLRAKGMFSSDYAPIETTFTALHEFLSAESSMTEDKLRKALAANDQMFVLFTEDGEETVVTTRLGVLPVEMRPDTSHTFAERFMTPEPAPERPLRTEKPIPEIVVNAQIADEIRDARDQAASVEHDLQMLDGIMPPRNLEHKGVKVELLSEEEAAAMAAAREKRQQEQEQEQVAEAEALAPEVAAAPEEDQVAEPQVTETEEVATEAEAVSEPVEAELEPEAEPNVPEVEEQAAAPVVEEATKPERAAEQAQPEPEPEPDVEPEPEKVLTDLSGFSDDQLSEAIASALAGDSRFAIFGDKWMPESAVHRLSRGNLRRIADDINEQERPLTDDVLAQDVLGARRSSSDFASVRFSLNYGLASERGFEFLGTHDQPFWGTTELSQIGTTRRKATDIGTDYRFLVEEAPLGSVAPRSVTSIEHTLSFYEFTYGLLPLDERMQALLPAPTMQDQRAAVLTVEIPQFENSVYLVEVRYPTQTRGGFILGLDDFYEEKLVPGAMVSIQATGNDGHYKIEFLEDDEQQDRFLELDDRRAPKYVFRPLTFDTAVAPEWLVTESRFPGFNSEKPLSEKKRRRIEDVIDVTFERIGTSEGTAKVATFQDLLVAVNVERPASEKMMRDAIENMTSVSDDGSGNLSHDTAS